MMCRIWGVKEKRLQGLLVTPLEIRDVDEEEDVPQRGPKPKWPTRPLHDQPEEWQAELFHDQMNKLTQRKEAFICEKEVRDIDLDRLASQRNFVL